MALWLHLGALVGRNGSPSRQCDGPMQGAAGDSASAAAGLPGARGCCWASRDPAHPQLITCARAEALCLRWHTAAGARAWKGARACSTLSGTKARVGAWLAAKAEVACMWLSPCCAYPSPTPLSPLAPLTFGPSHLWLSSGAWARMPCAALSCLTCLGGLSRLMA